MTEINKCAPPSVEFTIDDERSPININEQTPEGIKKMSHREVMKRQRKIFEILKDDNMDGKLMRFRKMWRCSIGWHSWYGFYGYYSVCDNCGLTKENKSLRKD